MTRLESVTLPVNCPLCGGAVTLLVSESPSQSDPPNLSRATWRCPWCQQVNDGGFQGRISFATKRMRVPGVPPD